MTTDNNKYSRTTLLLTLLIGVVLGLLFANRFDGNSRQRQTADNTMGNRIKELMHIIDEYYVDTVNYDSLNDQIMNAILATLDPHSHYLSPTELSQEMELMQGAFEGIGVVLYYYGDTVYAGNVNKGSPAERAGIHAGDRIMRVDTTLVSGAGLTSQASAVVNLIRGPRRSTVTLTVQREGSQQLHRIKVQRDVIHHTSLPAAVMLDKHTGYIHLTRFAETSGDEFHNALLKLTQQHMTHLILDLRGNGGGSLSSAIAVADELLPKGNLIVYTQGAHDRRRDEYATAGGAFEQGKVTVLINETSASASEIVAGAIQDNDRGRIMGRCSFGKGLVQRQFELPGDAAMLLTIARYYTPSGRCIQRPYDKGSDEYYMKYIERVLSSELDNDILLNAPDSTQCYHTKKGRKVYGGGGIQPDKILPLHGDKRVVYYNRLLAERVISEAVYDELFVHYNAIIRKYPTPQQFLKDYQVDEATWQRILHKADAKGILRDAESIRRYGKEIRNNYKAVMASALYDDNAYYSIILPYDHELQQAMR